MTNVFIMVFIIVKAMKIFNAFLIITLASILFMLPFTSAIYDFRTDLRTDTFAGTATGGAETTANLSLTNFVFDDDTETIEILSDDGADVPLLSSYNTTTRLTDITGLAVSSNRTITIMYDIDALSESKAVSTILDRVPAIFLLVVIAFPMAGLFAIFTNRLKD